MHVRIALLTAAFSATATAQVRIAPRTTTLVDDSEPTHSTTPECESRIESWTNGFPTPAPALEDALDQPVDADSGADWSSIDGLCKFAAQLPSTVLPEFSSYNLEMYSYLSSQSSNLVALATSCSADMGAEPSLITSELAELLTMYSSFSAGACDGVTATGTESASATKTATKSGLTSVVSSTGSAATQTASTDASAAASSGASASANASSSATTTASQNASPRETGMFAAAALAMGVLGAAVAL
ncbi:hypothetical protein F4806DRAFT_491283 [Annulohypoxylon nitens]|nr:hypothetical protein F4806DRAFT_491283 [Annulohypoxylon nitens]